MNVLYDKRYQVSESGKNVTSGADLPFVQLPWWSENRTLPDAEISSRIHRRGIASQLHTHRPRIPTHARGSYDPLKISTNHTSLFDDAPSVDDDVGSSVDLGGSGDDIARVCKGVFFRADGDGI